MFAHGRTVRIQWTLSVDSGMCIEAQDHKIQLVKQLETVLQGRIKPSELHIGCVAGVQRPNASKVITQCCIVELYKMGKDRQAAVDLAKEFERRKCNHREPIDGPRCLQEVVGMISLSPALSLSPKQSPFQAPLTSIAM